MKSIFAFVSLLCTLQPSFAQEDLLQELTKEPIEAPVIAIFKGTRIVNGQSVEAKPGGSLEFIFSHRFGRVNEGAYTLWGLDDAFVRLGLEYGITDKLGVGLGRTSVDKSYDAYIRYKVIGQAAGKMPLTIATVGTINYKTSPKQSDSPVPITVNDRISYVAQVLIARKLNQNFSLQVNPLMVHRNTVDQTYENNTDFALGLAGRHKVTRSLAITGEYIYRLNAKPNIPPDYIRYDAVGFGIDIETGGHVFQLVFTNSLGLIERAIVTETTGNFWDGDIHFGFNITRTFQLTRKK